MLKHEKTITICNHHADIRGTLGVKTLCDLFNDVANEQTTALGVDVDTFNAAGITWMLHRIRLLLPRLPARGQQITIATWPSGADRLFAFRDFAVRDTSGELLVRATSEWMVIDLHRRRPVRLPASVLAMAATHEGVTRELGFTLSPKGDTTAPLSTATTGRRRFVASYDTIDFNRHVTQASYVGWVAHALPFDFLNTHLLEEMEVLYEREILPDSEVHSIYRLEERDEKTHISHQVTDTTEQQTHCIARSVWRRFPANPA
ncbi:MAG: acyl-ACP thioesterase [Odoribacteraceae bacterium]|jgi:acyl-ACP thioesterase|nr:acyl-ACP thioesterase [Odoribacteraceae bacterium]